ncbi:MAG: response regulator [bacterium]
MTGLLEIYGVKTYKSRQWWYTVINRILIIDDEIIFCKALKYHLTQKGYDVDICNSYHEFQHEIDLFQFDLILLDIHLEDIHGLDLFKIAQEINPKIKVIIISAYLDYDNISKAKELGAYDFVYKNTKMFQVLDQLFDGM